MTLETDGEEGGPQASHIWNLGLKVCVVDFLSGYSIPGVLEGFTPGEAVVFLEEALPLQREVSVHIDSFAFEGQILYCQSKDTRYEAHITIDDAEETGLRRSPRFPVKLPAKLFPPNGNPVDITIVDISREGLGIELPVSVEPGHSIAVASGSLFVFAVVRHCREVSQGLFRAGVETHHLLDKPVPDVHASEARSGFLGRVWGKRASRAGP